MESKILEVIKQRLKLQSTERTLDNMYGLSAYDFFLDPAGVKNIYKLLDDNKKKHFIKLIGGPANYLATKQYIENLS